MKSLKRKHYKHEMFETTIVNASAKKSLAEAAPEWIFSHFGVVSKKSGNCQICHARIQQFVTIENTANKVVLIIGGDCYDKLLRYLATNKVESISLPARRKYIGEIKKYCKKNINASFLAWFGKQRGLSEEMRNTLKVIESIGYAPSLAAAEKLVEYYKGHRFFSLAELASKDELAFIRDAARFFGMEIPRDLTISQLSIMRDTIALAGKELIKHIQHVNVDVARIPLKNASVCMRKYDHPPFHRYYLRTELGGKTVEMELSDWSDIDDDFWASFRRGFNDEKARALAETAPSEIFVEEYDEERPFFIRPTDCSMRVWNAKAVCHLRGEKFVKFESAEDPRGRKCWECRDGERLYVLDYRCSYNPARGAVPVRVVRDLVPAKVILVTLA